jgi:hypothetical protein
VHVTTSCSNVLLVTLPLFVSRSDKQVATRAKGEETHLLRHNGCVVSPGWCHDVWAPSVLFRLLVQSCNLIPKYSARKIPS